MKKRRLILWCVIIVIAIIVFFPYVNILSVVGNLKSVNLVEIKEAIYESIITTGFVVLVTFPLSLLCAICIHFSNIRFKFFLSFMCLIPLFIPPISIGFGLLSILGKNGFVFSIFGLRLNFVGRFGVIVGHILYTFPISFLLFLNAFRSLDMCIYENTTLLGIPFHKYLFGIVFPIIWKTAVAAFFQIIVMSISEYGVCLVVGGRIKTISLLIYRRVIGNLDFTAGLILGGISLLPLLILSICNILSPRSSQGIIYKKASGINANNICLNALAYIFLFVVLIFNSSLIISLIIMGFVNNFPLDMSFTLEHFKQVLSVPYIYYLFNSILIAFFSSIFGCLLSSISAYYSIKGSPNIGRRLLYFLSTLSYAIPGLLFGIGYLITYKASFLRGTFTIMVLVNIAHFFASPFLLSFYSLSKFSPEVEDAMTLFNIQKQKQILDIYFPYMKSTLLDMFMYYFTNSMITISAVVFLYTSRTMTYALVLSSFEGGLEYLSKSASITIIIFMTNIFVLICRKRLDK